MYSICNGMRLEFKISDMPRPRSGSFLPPYLRFINDLSFLNHPLSWAAVCRWLLGQGLGPLASRVPCQPWPQCDVMKYFLREFLLLVKLSVSWLMSVFSHLPLWHSPLSPWENGWAAGWRVTCQPGPPPPTPERTAICREARGEHRQSKNPHCSQPLLPCAWLVAKCVCVTCSCNEQERCLRGSWARERAGRKPNWSTSTEHVS